MKLVIFFVGALIASSQAWFFGRSGRQEAEGPVSQDCINLARRGDCHFYTCFDERHPCTNNNYALNYGWRYCVRFEQNYPMFTQQGKDWVNNTRKCAMDKMLEFYEATHINCEDVQAEMKDNHGRCEADHGLCDSNLLTENKEAFRNIYGVTKKTVMRFVFSVKHCGLSTVRDVVGWFDNLDLNLDFDSIRDQIRDHWEDLQDTLGDAFEDIRGAVDDFDVDDLGDFFRRLHPGA